MSQPSSVLTADKDGWYRPAVNTDAGVQSTFMALRNDLAEEFTVERMLCPHPTIPGSFIDSREGLATSTHMDEVQPAPLQVDKAQGAPPGLDASVPQLGSVGPKSLPLLAPTHHIEPRQPTLPPANIGGMAKESLAPAPTVEVTAMQQLVEFIGLAVDQSVQKALSNFTPVLERQNEIIRQLAPLATLLPSARASTSAKNEGRSTVSHSTPNGEYDGGEEDNDDCDDAPISRVKRSRGERDNVFHDRFREYLKVKGLLPKARDSPLSLVPKPEIMQAWHDGEGDGPDVTTPLIEWSLPLSSAWNKEVIHIVTEEFLKQVAGGEHPPLVSDPAWTITTASQCCLHKLQNGPHKRFTEVELMEDEEVESARNTAKKQRRKNSRRETVYKRRGDIIEVNLQDNPAIWGKVKIIHMALGQGGISSDETNGEYTRRNDKKVRRVCLPWRHPSLAAFYRNVDSYEDVHPLHLTEQGNYSLSRIFEANASSSSKRKLITQLPKNFYNPDWMKTITRAQRSTLWFKLAFEIPDLIRSVFVCRHLLAHV
ncbi:hypothetical protein SCP_0703520 [Sparassis crispa]|uniref:Uncharacterized protein n=1 Tax=Sparassis crispa TaxID=139825 RepID=A0A401GSH5_9APHY|nr:hypothetical protein SCP_0703520 [Sparassis crispa]GBE85166.1 hypothetical protein SCP_0703520 [Sparassis crispa]